MKALSYIIFDCLITKFSYCVNQILILYILLNKFTIFRLSFDSDEDSCSIMSIKKSMGCYQSHVSVFIICVNNEFKVLG